MKKIILSLLFIFSLCEMIPNVVYLTITAENGSVKIENNRDGTYIIIIPKQKTITSMCINGMIYTDEIYNYKFNTDIINTNTTIDIIFDSVHFSEVVYKTMVEL